MEKLIFVKARLEFCHMKIMSKSEVDQCTIKHINNQIDNLQQGPDTLYANSRWKYIGRKDHIENLSDMKRSNSKLEALSFRLKLATGTQNGDPINTIIKNHRQNGTEVIKGFIQGLITATLEKNNKRTLPERQIKS